MSSEILWKLDAQMQNPGPSAQVAISSVSWNPKFPHIVASTSYNGMTGEISLSVQLIFHSMIQICCSAKCKCTFS